MLKILKINVYNIFIAQWGHSRGLDINNLELYYPRRDSGNIFGYGASILSI